MASFLGPVREDDAFFSDDELEERDDRKDLVKATLRPEVQRLRSFLSNYHRTFAELDSVGLRVRHPRGNVFIAGPVGAGKSSLLNSLLSAILGKRVDVETAPSGTHVTTKFHVRDVDGCPGLRIMDSWVCSSNRSSLTCEQGWTVSNYSRSEFDYILKGRLRHGVERPEAISPPSFDADVALRPVSQAGDFRVHAAILVLSWRALTNEATLSRFRSFVMACRDEREIVDKLACRFTEELTGVPVTVAVTQADLDVADLRSKPSLTLWSSLISDKLDDVAQKICVARRDIFPVVNYLDETRNSPEIDFLALRVLRHALELHDDRLLDSALTVSSGDDVKGCF